MIQALQNFIQKEKLFQPNEKVLLAVSGGVDSVVLCHLFHQAKFDFGIAHCNFKLRGNDSDGDALFVKKLAEEWQVPFFEIAFETENVKTALDRAIEAGATLIQDVRNEPWGQTTCYVSDPNGYLVEICSAVKMPSAG